MNNTLRIYGFSNESVVDGPGIRVVIFVQGCDNACPGCHNPNSWDITGGDEYTIRDLIKKIRKAARGGVGNSNPVFTPRTSSPDKKPPSQKIRGVTFSGGEPFLQASGLAQIGKAVKGLGLDITTYTGHTYEELAQSEDINTKALLDITDYLIDGPYIQEQRDISLRFRGSCNQRIIDMGKTREAGAVVLYEEH